MLSVDQVVGGIGKVRRATWRCGPTSQRIGERNLLGEGFGQRFFIESLKGEMIPPPRGLLLAHGNVQILHIALGHRPGITV